MTFHGVAGEFSPLACGGSLPVGEMGEMGVFDVAADGLGERE